MPNVVSGAPDFTDESIKEWGKYERPGDIKHMKCHDCFCFIIFLVLFGAMVAILALGISKGKIWSIYNSWDKNGQYCGIDNTKIKDDVANNTDFDFRDLTNYPYLFFDAWDPKNQICVKECPSSGDILEVLKAKLVTSVTEFEALDVTNLTEDMFDADYYQSANQVLMYTTKAMFNRCVPQINSSAFVNASGLIDGFNQMVNSIPSLATSFNSISKLWKKILVCSVASLVVSFFWIFLMRCLTGCIVYTVVFLVPILIIAIGVWLFVNGNMTDTISEITEKKSLDAGQITALVFWAVALIILLIIIFLFKKLKQAVQMIKISSKALGSNWIIIFTPVFSMILAILFWAAVLVSTVYVYTAADFEIRANEEGTLRIEFQENQTLQYFIIYNLIYLIYISVHVYFTNYYAQSSAVVNWYFSGQEGIGCGCSCWRGYLNACTKSLGTITVSSLIMTPLYLFIIFMEYLDAKSRTENPSELLKCVLKCFKCCLKCFTKIVNYLNKTLLTAQQIFNKNWWHSAGVIVDVVVSDVVMTTLLNGVTFFIIFLSKIVVSGLCALGFFVWVDKTDAEMSGYLISAFIVFFLSYIISSFILSAYSNIIDIVFVCFQSEKSIPGYTASTSAEELNKTIEEMKEARLAENGKVAAAGPEDYSEEEEVKPKKKRHHHHK